MFTIQVHHSWGKAYYGKFENQSSAEQTLRENGWVEENGEYTMLSFAQVSNFSGQYICTQPNISSAKVVAFNDQLKISDISELPKNIS